MLKLCCVHLISLYCHQAQTDRDGASNHITDFFTEYYTILNLEGHTICIIGSKVTPILLNLTEWLVSWPVKNYQV